MIPTRSPPSTNKGTPLSLSSSQHSWEGPFFPTWARPSTQGPAHSSTQHAVTTGHSLWGAVRSLEVHLVQKCVSSHPFSWELLNSFRYSSCPHSPSDRTRGLQTAPLPHYYSHPFQCARCPAPASVPAPRASIPTHLKGRAPPRLPGPQFSLVCLCCSLSP